MLYNLKKIFHNFWHIVTQRSCFSTH